jgi:hypothetical protein
VRLDKGRVSVDVRAPGYVSTSDTLSLAGGEKAERTYALVHEPAVPPAAPPPKPVTPLPPPVAKAEPAPMPEPATSAPATPSTTESGPAPTPAPAVTVSLASPTPGPLRPIAWVAAGAAVVGIGVGTYGAITALNERDAFNDHKGLVGGVLTNDCGTDALTMDCKTIKDRRDRAVTISIVGFAAGGLLAITAVTLFIVSAPEPVMTQVLACAPDLAGHGASCAFRF